MSQSSLLAESQLTRSPHDLIEVELIAPDGMPAQILIHWPQQPSVLPATAQALADIAAPLVRCLAAAQTALNTKRSR